MIRCYFPCLVVILFCTTSCKKASRYEEDSANEIRQELNVNSQSENFSAATDSKTLRNEAEFLELKNDLSSELQKQDLNQTRLEELLKLFLENDEMSAYRFLVQADGVVSYTLVNQVLSEHLLNQKNVEALHSAIQVLDKRPDIGTPLLGMVTKVWAKENAAEAYEWLCQHTDFSGTSNAALEIGSQVGLLDDPVGLLTSIESRDPPLQVVSPFIRGVIESWAANARSPEEAGQWLNIFPPQEVVDEAVYSYVNQARQNDPKAAMSWAESISDEGLRRSAMLETASFWEKRDPESYDRWKNYREEKALP